MKPGDIITFRGCIFDAGWEFDAPCILYSPYKRSGYGGNSGHIDHMVEDVLIDLTIHGKVRRGFSDCDLKEFKWRGWSPRGFARRKNAYHVEIKVRVEATDDLDCVNGIDYVPFDRREWWGGEPKGGTE